MKKTVIFASLFVLVASSSIAAPVDDYLKEIEIKTREGILKHDPFAMSSTTCWDKAKEYHLNKNEKEYDEVVLKCEALQKKVWVEVRSKIEQDKQKKIAETKAKQDDLKRRQEAYKEELRKEIREPETFLEVVISAKAHQHRETMKLISSPKLRADKEFYYILGILKDVDEEKSMLLMETPGIIFDPLEGKKFRVIIRKTEMDELIKKAAINDQIHVLGGYKENYTYTGLNGNTVRVPVFEGLTNRDKELKFGSEYPTK
jgi:hypothetical protein